MSLQEILGSIRTDDLVSQFKKALIAEGVSIADDPVAKYFAAEKENTLLLLAHESTLENGWWGIHRDIVERVLASEHVNAKPDGWGAVLLHKTHRRGYWIKGEDIFELKTLRLATLGKQGQYHFNQVNLDKSPNLAKQFFSVKTVLSISGLQK